jgi:hypothetical protein
MLIERFVQRLAALEHGFQQLDRDRARGQHDAAGFWLLLSGCGRVGHAPPYA